MKKIPTIRPWRVSFFQKQSESDKKLYEQLSDLYLVRNTYKDNLQDYQINNDKKEPVLKAKCHRNSGTLDVIELYCPDGYNGPVLKVQKDSSDYVIIKEEVVIGRLQIQKDRLCFLNLDNEVICSAILVNADNYYQPLDLVLISEWFNKIRLHFIFKGKDNEKLGKYFVALRNLDLTRDKKILLNRHIAIALAIIIDEVIATSIKPLPPIGIDSGLCF